MADTDPHNQQYVDPPFSMSAGIASTGAPGSAGDTAAQTQGPVIGSPVVSIPGASSQVPANMPAVPVGAGDTSGMSSDQAVGDNFTAISGDAAAGLSATGAGEGHAGHFAHPSAGR
jgi:hypothetical protein